jgi:hypothetical protein
LADRFARNNNHGNGRGGTGRGDSRGYQGQGRGCGSGRGSGIAPPSTTNGSNLLQIAAPPPSQGGLFFTQLGSTTSDTVCLAQSHDGFPDGIPNHFVLLDSDSTVSIFNNPTMLNDIHEVDAPLVLQSNGGGHCVTSQMGFIKDFGKVWFHPNSIANILSLAQVRKARRITMDSSADAAFHVHLSDGSGYTRFKEHSSGLYLYDTTEGKTPYASTKANTNDAVFGYSYLQTVADNKKAFTKRQIDAPTPPDCSTVNLAVPEPPASWTSSVKTSLSTVRLPPTT